MMKNFFKVLVIYAAFFSGSIPAGAENISPPEGKDTSSFPYILAGDILFKADKCGRTMLYDKVLAVTKDSENKTACYIRNSEDRWIAGFLKADTAESIEFKIPWKYEKLYKLAVNNGIFYYLADPDKEAAEEKTNPETVYVRFNPDQMTSQSVSGVSDFCLIDGKSVLLRGNILDYNGVHIPLTLTGNREISEIIDSRIVLISGENGTEFVDLIAEKSFYQYKDKSIPEIPEEYNVILEFEDKTVKSDNEPDPENSIYYEISIDGMEENRTETGRGEVVKVINLMLQPGSYHMIKAERWELDKVKGRYIRMNNVYQPSELKIFIPENRIIKIKVEFNGTEYSMIQSVLYK